MRSGIFLSLWLAIATTLMIITSYLQSQVGYVVKVTPPPKYKKHKPLLCTGCIGRTGNQLFQFASGYGLARTYNRRFLWKGYPFLSDMDLSKWTGNQKCSARIHEQGWGKFNNFSSLLQDLNVHVDCYLQSWKHFAPYESELRGILRFSNRTLAKAKRVLLNITKCEISKVSCPKNIAIHVRLGIRYKEVNTKFVNTSMQYFKQKFKQTNFIIVSGNVKLARKSLPTFDLKYSTCTDPFCDLALMSLADAVVLTRISSFGWWGGWLSGKEVVREAQETIPMWVPGWYADDYYPPHWTSL